MRKKRPIDGSHTHPSGDDPNPLLTQRTWDLLKAILMVVSAIAAGVFAMESRYLNQRDFRSHVVQDEKASADFRATVIEGQKFFAQSQLRQLEARLDSGEKLLPGQLSWKKDLEDRVKDLSDQISALRRQANGSKQP